MSSTHNWWKTTFGETYLRAFAPDTPHQTKKEVLFIIKKLFLKRGARILDVPCGQGRHSIEFAKRGFRTTGVDYSPTLLAVARQKAGENRVFPRLIKGDMRFIKLWGRFDAIVVLGNSFGYFDDTENEKVIANLSGLLKKNGRLVLDLSNLAGMLKTAQTKERHTKRVKKEGGIVEIREESLFDPLRLVKTLRWTVSENNKKETMRARLRFYTFPEISSMLAQHKLRVIRTFGSFDGKPYGFETPRLIIVARKR